MQIVKRVIPILASLVIALYSCFVLANNIVVSAYTNDNYLRIIFGVPQDEDFDASLNGNNLTVTLNGTFIPQVGSSIRDSKLIKKFNANSDGNRFTFKLIDGEYKIRKFMGDNSVGVDVVGIDVSLEDDSTKEKAREEALKAKPANTEKDAPKALTLSLEKAKDSKPSNFFSIKTSKDFDSMIFAWDTPTALAIFERSGYTWIVFNKYKNVDVSSLPKSYLESQINYTQIQDPNSTIIKMKLPSSKITTERNGNSWVINFLKEDTPQQNIVDIKDYSVSETSFIFAKGSNGFIEFKDDLVGDHLIIIPFYDYQYQVSSSRTFGEFKLLKTSQGMVVDPFSDGLKVAVTDSQIAITPESVATLPKIDSPEQDDSSLTISSIQNHKTFLERKKELEDEIYSSTPETKAKVYFDLAEFYFKEDLYYESMGTITLLRKLDTDYSSQYKIKLIAVINNIMALRPFNAKNEFDTINDKSLNEIQLIEYNFWKNIINYYTASENNPINFLEYQNQFMNAYPKKVKIFLALLDLKDRIYKNDLAAAQTLCDTLIGLDLNNFDRNYVLYNQALIFSKNGKIKDASTIFDSLSIDLEDRQIRAMAGLANTKMLVADEKLSKDDAIATLNKLRPVWRGDLTEAEILRYLGALYKEKNDFINSLRTYKDYITSFSSGGESLTIASEMSKMFVDIFNSESDINKKLTDLEAVSLYYEFRELTPIGKAGDDIIQNLANRLINLDLLDRATALLEHQVKYRFKDEEKIKSSNKLALLYILNRDPQKAIDTLDQTNDSSFVEQYIVPRSQLRIKALLDLNQFELASTILDMLPDSIEKQNLKLEMSWNQGDWRNVVNILAPRISNPTIENPELKEQLSMISVAYAMLRQNAEINNIINAYTNYIKDDQNLTDTLQFLAEDKGLVDYRDLNTTLEIGSIESFLQKFKTSYLNENKQ